MATATAAATAAARTSVQAAAGRSTAGRPAASRRESVPRDIGTDSGPFAAGRPAQDLQPAEPHPRGPLRRQGADTPPTRRKRQRPAGRLVAVEQVAALRRGHHPVDEPQELRVLLIEHRVEAGRFAQRAFDPRGKLARAVGRTGGAGRSLPEPCGGRARDQRVKRKCALVLRGQAVESSISSLTTTACAASE